MFIASAYESKQASTPKLHCLKHDSYQGQKDLFKGWHDDTVFSLSLPPFSLYSFSSTPRPIQVHSLYARNEAESAMQEAS